MPTEAEFEANGALSLTDSVVTGNSTSGNFADGGGIFAVRGATLLRSLIDNNETSGGAATGGGIFVVGSATIDSSTVSNNRTQGDDSRGGGIASAVNPLSVINSTVSGNKTFGGESAQASEPWVGASARSVRLRLPTVPLPITKRLNLEPAESGCATMRLR